LDGYIAKVDVAGSNPVSRSKIARPTPPHSKLASSSIPLNGQIARLLPRPARS